mgnify:CR=1 FL=1
MLLLASAQVRCKLAPLAEAWAPTDFVLRHLMIDCFDWAREGVINETAGQPVQCPQLLPTTENLLQTASHKNTAS